MTLRPSRVLRALLAGILMLSVAPAVAAQSITDARRVEFTPSADHSAIDPTSGQALVTKYTIDVYVAGAPTPLQTADLGKPTPETDGMIRVDFVSLLATALTPGVVYEAIVNAVGPGGTTSTPRSNTFGFSPPCAPTISPTSSNLTTSAAATGSVTVTAGTGCTWTAVSNVGWITISAGTAGSANGSVSYNVAANTSTTARSGTLTIAGQTFTVTQAAAPCTYTISPTSSNLTTSAATTGTVTVTAGSGCSWSATSNAGWMTISAGASGNGNGSVSYNVTANSTTTSSRTGTMTIAGQPFTITQAGAPCTFTIAPTSSDLTASVATIGMVNVSAPTGCDWTAASNDSWLTITSGSTGNGSAPVNYSVAANTVTTPRTGTMLIAGQTFSVTQAAAPCTYVISPASLALPASGGAGIVTVTAASNCSWTASSGATWVNITGGAIGTGSGTVTYTAGSNAGTIARTATLTIAGATYTVTEPSASCTFSISPALATISPAGATGTLTVTTAAGCSWTTSADASWVTIAGAATGPGTATYTISANTGSLARSASISVAGVPIAVNQNAITAPTTPTNLRIIK